MKFGMNVGTATKVGDFILSILLAAALILAICVMIKGPNAADAGQQSRQQPSPQLKPSAAR